MNSDTRNEFEARYNALVAKIRKAAAIALKEIDRLHSGGPMAREAFDAEVARITQEKLQPYGCDLVIRRTDDGIARFLIKIQSTGEEYDLIQSFFHRDDGLVLGAEV
jgi:Ni,Fe-hydrogenase III large subunit